MIDRLAGLAARARDGDRDAEDELLHASAGIAHAVARAWLGDTLDADAAAADALSQASAGLRRLRDPRAWPRWLHRIATRSAARSRREWRPRSVADPAIAADPGAGPLEVLVERERKDLLERAVASLSRRLREPLLLHFSEGLSYREIADVLGVGLGSVARRMSRAYEILASRLGEDR
jgi:RNA polymerase sigma-70 factor (ECF subfamily)